ncbi:glutaminase A [Methylocella sp.]|uniref:glutaminase A n=1 Tax=Methylocella sp. TaxID=1978226 RepID=UPI003784C9AD
MLSSPLQTLLEELRAELAGVGGGEVASYIPALAGADPNALALAVATTDGRVFSVGDADLRFSIQSISKPFAYAAALDRLGREATLAKVGVEPTGDAFNAIVLDSVGNRPFNPMVNAGAIAVSALFPGDSRAARAGAMLETLSRFAGRPLDVDEEMFRSEAMSGHRNRAIAWLMLNAGMIEAMPDDALDVYFRQCAVSVDVRDLAVMAATLANGGVNPLTGARAVAEDHVCDVLTVMLTCGMYDYAGQWAHEVGLPAKSGVSGGIVAAAPGQFGIAAFSPPLDRFGNSVRAVAACRLLSERLSLHVLGARPQARAGRVLAGDALRSTRGRPAQDAARLDALARRILVIDAQGEICPAAAERLLRLAGEGLGRGEVTILNLSRAVRVERGAALLFETFLAELAAQGGAAARRLILAHAPPGLPAGATAATRAADLDAALEAAEDELLAEGASGPPEAFAPLAADWLAGLDPDEAAALLAALAPARRVFARGEHVFRRGEPARDILTVASGRLRVEAEAADGAAPRVAAVGPGATIGELALFAAAPRSADVVAEEDTVAWSVPLDALRAFLAARPEAASRILFRLNADLADRLRRSTAAARALGG